MNRLYCFVCVLIFVSAAEANIFEKMKSLGGNDVLFEKAKILTPEKNITIVQSRLMDRSFRNELSFEADVVLGGDALIHTMMLGANYQFHITPRWSVGIRGYMAFNELSSEGKASIERAILLRDNFSALRPLVPDIDYLRYASYLTASWYPFYGKLNFYDIGIGHYDIYLLSGVGRVWLRRGGALGVIAGGGFGFWFSENVSARLEVKYETYKAQRLSTAYGQRLHLTTLSFALGYIL